MADDFPVILGFGSMHDLSDHEHKAPRLAGLRSVSKAAAAAMAKTPEDRSRPCGFVQRRTRP